MAPLGWKLVAVLSLALAGLAMALPVLPSVPFLLLAAMAAGRGWPWLAQRLAAHPTLGPVLADWRERGVLPRPLKRLGLASLAISAATVWLWRDPLWVPLAADAVLAAFGAWLWTRPAA